jgi:ADP-ribose pyrophosphatase YjhB (NUDIX family)
VRASLLRLAHAAAGVYFKAVNPVTVGVKVVLIRDGTEVLLVRHTYGERSLHLPGGRVERKESLVSAARRELDEELNLKKGDYGILRLQGVYTNFAEGKSDHVVVFRTETSVKQVGPASDEIESARFYPLDDLPAGTSRGTRARLTESSEEARTEPCTW